LLLSYNKWAEVEEKKGKEERKERKAKKVGKTLRVHLGRNFSFHTKRYESRGNYVSTAPPPR